MIRFVFRDDRTFKTKFYRLRKIEIYVANTISDSFKSQLIRTGLSIEKVTGKIVVEVNLIVYQCHRPEPFKKQA